MLEALRHPHHPQRGQPPAVRTIASLSSRSSRSPSRAGVEPTRAASAAYSARNSASEMAAARTVAAGDFGGARAVGSCAPRSTDATTGTGGGDGARRIFSGDVCQPPPRLANSSEPDGGGSPRPPLWPMWPRSAVRTHAPVSDSRISGSGAAAGAAANATSAVDDVGASMKSVCTPRSTTAGPRCAAFASAQPGGASRQA